MLACAALLTAVSGLLLGGLRADYDPRSFHPRGTPLVELTRHVEAIFGPDDRTALIGVEDPALLTPSGLARVDALVRALGRTEGVEEAVGITNVRVPMGDGLDIGLRPVVERLPGTQAEAAAVARALRAEESVSGTLLSGAGDACLIRVTLREPWSAPKRRAQLHDTVQTLLREHAADGVAFHVGGLPMVRVQYARAMLSETGRLLGLALITLFVLMGLVLRSVVGPLLALLVVAAANVWTHGLMAALGEPFTVLSMLTPIIVMVVGVADTIHVLLAFRRATGSREDRVREATAAVAGPCLLTSVTTAIGFLALLSAGDIRMLQVYGLFTALGVVLAYVATLCLVPPLLASPWVRVGSSQPTPRGGAFGALVSRIVRRPAWTCALALCIGGVSAGVGSQVSTDARILDGLDASHPIMQTYHLLEERFAGSLPMQVVYRADPTGDATSSPALFRHVRQTADALRRQPVVGAVHSPDRIVRRLRQAVEGGDESEARIPDTADEVSELLLLASLGGDDPFTSFVSEPDGVVRIRALLHERGAHATLAAQEALLADIGSRPLPGVEVGLAGTAYLAPRAWRILLGRMALGLAIAVGLIALLFGLLFRSPVIGLVTIVPNLLPLAVVLGAMTLLDIPAKGNNAVIFSIAYGVAVDDTIHLLAQVRLRARGGLDWATAITAAHAEVRGALMLTTLLLVAGFSVFLFSIFEFSVTLGLQMVVAAAAALAADLLLLPALLAWIGPKTAQKA